MRRVFNEATISVSGGTDSGGVQHVGGDRDGRGRGESQQQGQRTTQQPTRTPCEGYPALETQTTQAQYQYVRRATVI